MPTRNRRRLFTAQRRTIVQARVIRNQCVDAFALNVQPLIEAVCEDLAARNKPQSLTGIASELNRLGVRSAYGKRWSARTVGRVLRPEGTAAIRRAGLVVQRGSGGVDQKG